MISVKGVWERFKSCQRLERGERGVGEVGESCDKGVTWVWERSRGVRCVVFDLKEV